VENGELKKQNNELRKALDRSQEQLRLATDAVSRGKAYKEEMEKKVSSLEGQSHDLASDK
ncbi:unnamed protein product, partial [Symbiodinium sp. CCMP2456]